MIVFNPTPVPAARDGGPASGPAPDRPHNALGHGLDTAAGSELPSEKVAETIHTLQAMNGAARPGEHPLSPTDTMRSLEPQLDHPLRNQWVHGPPGGQIYGDFRNSPSALPSGGGQAASGQHEEAPLAAADIGRPDLSSNVEGSPGAEPMQIDSAPPPAEARHGFMPQPMMGQVNQQWQDKPHGAEGSNQFPTTTSFPPSHASPHSAEQAVQQQIRMERPAGDVLLETQEELSKQEPAVSSGNLTCLSCFHPM